MENFEIYFKGLNHIVLHPADVILSAAAKNLTTGNVEFATVYALLQLSLIAGGSYWLVKERGASISNSFFLSALLVSALYFVNGLSVFALSIHWLPFFLVSASRFFRRGEGWDIFSSIIFGLLLVLSSGSLALFNLGISILFAWWNAGCKANGSSSWVFVVLSVSLMIFALLMLPIYSFPEYPSSARLVPESPLDARGSPLLGPWLSPNPVHFPVYLALNNAHLVRLLLVLVVVILSQVIGFGWRQRNGQLSAAFLLAASGTLALERYWPVDAGLVSPYRLFWETIPGISLANLPWLFVPHLLLLGLCFFPSFSRLKEKVALLLATTFLLPIYAQTVDSKHHIYPDERVVFESQHSVAPASERIAYSPSGWLFENYGSWLIAAGQRNERSFKRLERVLIGGDVSVETDAEPNSEGARYAVDWNMATRWTTVRPQQAGDWFQLRFFEPVSLARVVLLADRMPNDFPRGLKVLTSANCEDWNEVVSYPDWLGPFGWTKDGYPYLSRRSDVFVDFKKEEKDISCIRFVQTGADAKYLWSIIEIKLYNIAN